MGTAEQQHRLLVWKQSKHSASLQMWLLVMRHFSLSNFVPPNDPMRPVLIRAQLSACFANGQLLRSSNAVLHSHNASNLYLMHRHAPLHNCQLTRQCSWLTESTSPSPWLQWSETCQGTAVALFRKTRRRTHHPVEIRFVSRFKGPVSRVCWVLPAPSGT